jgi:ADP-ribosylglycohydrolase
MIEDRRKGALYGQAIGDALGMPWEFTTGEQCTEKKVTYRKPFITHMSKGWEAGDFTDDTAQALALAYGLLEEPEDLERAALAIGDGFQAWLANDGRGCGNLTLEILLHPAYGCDPIAVANEIWEGHGKTQAPNGGVMRTVGAAIIRPWDMEYTRKVATLGCQVTHADSRCVNSCVAVSLAIAHLIQTGDIVGALQAGLRENRPLKTDLDFERHYGTKVLEGLNLNESHKIGYTYKCMGAGIWALRKLRDIDERIHQLEKSGAKMLQGRGGILSMKFWEILTEVIKAGGDTDTNAAVAGALMGAHIGFSNLPEELVAGLKRKDELEALLAALPPMPEGL